MASGGLGDVAGSLPKALRKRLVGCRVVMPLYSGIKQELRDRMQFITHITVPVSWRRQYCGIFEAKIDGVIFYFIDNEYYFKRDGIYGHYDDKVVDFCLASGIAMSPPQLFSVLKK